MGMVLGMRVAIRPISAMMMSRALASTVSFGDGGSGGGVLAPWWSFHALVVGAAVADGIELGAAVAVGVDVGA